MSKTNEAIKLLWRITMDSDTALTGVPKGHTGLRRIRKWRKGRRKLLGMQTRALSKLAQLNRLAFND